MDMMLIYGVAAVVMVIAILWLVKSGSTGSGLSDSRAQSALESAALAKRKGDHEQAAMLYQNAAAQLTKDAQSDPALLSSALAGQAECMERLGNRKESERLRTQMVQLWETGLNNRKTSFLTDIDYQCMDADFGTSTRDVAEFYEKLLAYREKTVAQNSDEFINTVVIYSRLMRKLGETEIADQLEDHAKKLRKGGQ